MKSAHKWYNNVIWYMTTSVLYLPLFSAAPAYGRNSNGCIRMPLSDHPNRRCAKHCTLLQSPHHPHPYPQGVPAKVDLVDGQNPAQFDDIVKKYVKQNPQIARFLSTQVVQEFVYQRVIWPMFFTVLDLTWASLLWEICPAKDGAASFWRLGPLQTKRLPPVAIFWYHRPMTVKAIENTFTTIPTLSPANEPAVVDPASKASVGRPVGRISQELDWGHIEVFTSIITTKTIWTFARNWAAWGRIVFWLPSTRRHMPMTKSTVKPRKNFSLQHLTHLVLWSDIIVKEYNVGREKQRRNQDWNGHWHEPSTLEIWILTESGFLDVHKSGNVWKVNALKNHTY